MPAGAFAAGLLPATTSRTLCRAAWPVRTVPEPLPGQI